MAKPPLCKNQQPDGRVCDLYLGHYGDHKEKHLKSSWSVRDLPETVDHARSIIQKLDPQHNSSN